MCKCVVEDGGGDVLPTEVGHLSRAEQQEKVRLSCQVKVKEDMNIRVPEEIFGIKKWECEVVSNYNVSTFIKEFVVKLPEGETLDFQSGGYIQIDVTPIEVDYKNFDITAQFSYSIGGYVFDNGYRTLMNNRNLIGNDNFHTDVRRKT